MDFIKKHYEKLLVALALVVLIGVAAVLAFKVTNLNQEITDAPRRPKPAGKKIDPIQTAPYQQAIASLQTPATWRTNAVDPFDTGEKQPPKPPPKIDPEANREPFALSRIHYKPFKLKFKEYTGAGENFQIDFLTRKRSFIIPKIGLKVADQFEDTGYSTATFTQRFTNIYNAALGVTNKVDVSELVIQRGSDDPIKLIYNQIAQEKEPLATVACAADGQIFDLVRDQRIACGGKTYKVVDITSSQVIIVDEQSGEKHIYSLPGVKE